jgi:hypothetical protein
VSATIAVGAHGSLTDLTGGAAVAAYRLTEQYTEALARHPGHRTLHAGRRAPHCPRSVSMIEASFLPLLTVLSVGSLGVPVEVAANTGLGVAALSLAAISAVAGRRSGLSVLGSLLAGVITAGLGG